MAKARRKPLEQWQRDDADRLKKIWESESRPSQDQFGDDHEIGGQGAVWQYLNGYIPLSLAVAAKFAKGLGCTVDEISPTLAQHAREFILPYMETGKTQGPSEMLVSKYRAADKDIRELVDVLLERFQSRRSKKS